jgi:hypothetical protein
VNLLKISILRVYVVFFADARDMSQANTMMVEKSSGSLSEVPEMFDLAWKRFIFRLTANIAELWRINCVRWDVALQRAEP